eukprot:CAMPEP_0184093514 /NCGR_PEP_ID=MMETSP0974-20121125/8794_1 /TAXON_ID=483370 /ORGANISM="non described non described, Strain CCMP2097" /LENGTH=40 /DNA_ID= /DNA_START= /DNA_END= /DNA_ORIENTATION=
MDPPPGRPEKAVLRLRRAGRPALHQVQSAALLRQKVPARR